MTDGVQRSLVILKPDAIERRLIGEITRRFEALGLDLAAAKTMIATEDELDRHYPSSLAESVGRKGEAAGADTGGDVVAYGQRILGWNHDYMRRGTLLVMLWEGEDAIKQIRAAIGTTDPSTAPKGSVRGDLGIDSIASANREQRGAENLVHASGSPEEAETEIAIWFP